MTRSLGIVAKFSLMEEIRDRGLGGVRTSIGVCFKVAPDKIIHWIKIRAARRPLLLGEEVVALLT